MVSPTRDFKERAPKRCKAAQPRAQEKLGRQWQPDALGGNQDQLVTASAGTSPRAVDGHAGPARCSAGNCFQQRRGDGRGVTAASNEALLGLGVQHSETETRRTLTEFYSDRLLL